MTATWNVFTMPERNVVLFAEERDASETPGVITYLITRGVGWRLEHFEVFTTTDEWLPGRSTELQPEEIASIARDGSVVAILTTKGVIELTFTEDEMAIEREEEQEFGGDHHDTALVTVLDSATILPTGSSQPSPLVPLDITHVTFEFGDIVTVEGNEIVVK